MSSLCAFTRHSSSSILLTPATALICFCFAYSLLFYHSHLFFVILSSLLHVVDTSLLEIQFVPMEENITHIISSTDVMSTAPSYLSGSVAQACCCAWGGNRSQSVTLDSRRHLFLDLSTYGERVMGCTSRQCAHVFGCSDARTLSMASIHPCTYMHWRKFGSWVVPLSRPRARNSTSRAATRFMYRVACTHESVQSRSDYPCVDMATGANPSASGAMIQKSAFEGKFVSVSGAGLWRSYFGLRRNDLNLDRFVSRGMYCTCIESEVLMRSNASRKLILALSSGCVLYRIRDMGRQGLPWDTYTSCPEGTVVSAAPSRAHRRTSVEAITDSELRRIHNAPLLWLGTRSQIRASEASSYLQYGGAAPPSTTANKA